MRIAIDFDGTIADTGQLFAPFCREHYGMDLPIEAHVEPLRSRVLNEEQIKEWREYYYRETLRAPLVLGARDAIQKLATEGHYIIILTARTKQGYQSAKDYLNLNRIPCNRLLCTARAEGRLLKGSVRLEKHIVLQRLKCGAMIEDQVASLLDERKDVIKGTLPILITRPWNKNERVPAKIIRLPDWRTILAFLLSEAPAEAA